ncbi:MAG: hypothetical protein GY765_39695, partial [bacterium]|nr:hypothetical protein [bacterium]
NGKEIPINAFFQETKMISTQEEKTAAKIQVSKPRLFVLVFHINDYNMKLQDQVDTIFEKVIHPGDRLILVSNHFFLQERVVTNPKKEKQMLKRILRIEANKTRAQLTHIEFELQGLADDLNTRLSAGDMATPIIALQAFITKYKDIFDGYTDNYNNMVLLQSKKMAAFLKTRDAKKWVINFHQVGMFPQLKTSRHSGGNGLGESLENLSRTSPWLRGELNRLKSFLAVAEVQNVKQFGKHFLDTEVTFHTLLMKGINTVALDYYEYKPVATAAETVMRQITKLTGGKEMSSANIDSFITQVVEHEDCYYMFSYIPPEGKKKKPKIKISLKNSKYRLVYDNHYRPWYARESPKDKTSNNPINIKTVSFVNGVLAVDIGGITMEQVDSRKIGKILLNIQVLNEAALPVTDVKKAFKCKKKTFVMRIKPPNLKSGKYDIVVNVKDILGGSNDIM